MLLGPDARLLCSLKKRLQIVYCLLCLSVVLLSFLFTRPGFFEGLSQLGFQSLRFLQRILELQDAVFELCFLFFPFCEPPFQLLFGSFFVRYPVTLQFCQPLSVELGFRFLTYPEARPGKSIVLFREFGLRKNLWWIDNGA